MDFYDLMRQRPARTHYAIAVNGDALKCPLRLLEAAAGLPS